jgi:hypothetical protein
MRNKQKVLSLILALAMAASMATSPAYAASSQASLPFPDIESSWAKDYIVQGYEQGLFGGNDDGTFAPERTLSRAELVQVLYNLEGKPAVSGTSKFTDGNGQWYTDAVLWGE